MPILRNALKYIIMVQSEKKLLLLSVGTSETSVPNYTMSHLFFLFAAIIIVTLDCRVSVLLKLLVSIFTTC